MQLVYTFFSDECCQVDLSEDGDKLSSELLRFWI